MRTWPDILWVLEVLCEVFSFLLYLVGLLLWLIAEILD